MRLRVLVPAAMAAFAAAPTFAAQWFSVSRNIDAADGHTYEVLVDLSSIKAAENTQPNVRTASVKYVRTPPRPHGKSDDRLAYSITFKSFECRTRRIRLDHSEVHFPDGSLQFVDTDKNKGVWHAAENPAAQKIMNIVCTFKTPMS